VVLAPASAAFADPSLAEIQDQVQKKADEVELVIEAYNKVNEDLAATQAALADLKTKMDPLQNTVDAAYVNVSKIAYAAYRSSSLRTASLLLNAKSSNSLMDQITLLDQVSKSQSRTISTYTEAKKGFDVEKKRLDELLAAQNAQKTDLETKKAKIEGDLKALQVLLNKAKAAGAKAPSANSGNVSNPHVSGGAGKAVDFAFAQLGKPYKYGASGPGSYDCSGLTMAAWKTAGVSLPHNAASQYSKLPHVAKANIVPGDLVFSNGLGHVSIYVGGGNVISAPHTGDVVKVQSLSTVGSIVGYGRPG
jgi:cell wall-associated NlpC family hydrolase